MLPNCKKYINDLKSILGLGCSLDELWKINENSPWIMYKTSIKFNLLAKVKIFGDENYIKSCSSCTLNTGTKINGNNQQ